MTHTHIYIYTNEHIHARTDRQIETFKLSDSGGEMRRVFNFQCEFRLMRVLFDITEV